MEDLFPIDDHVSWIVEQWRRERPDLDGSPQGVLGRLRRVNDHLTDAMVEVFESFGLTEGEFDVLATLRRIGAPYELQPSQVAEQTMVTSGAATKRLQRLQARGLVSKRGDERDGRARTIALTDAGKDLIDRAFTAHIANEQRLLDLVPPDERAALERVLALWLRHLEDR